MVDYEEIRANAAISALNGLLSSSIIVFVLEFLFRKQVVDIAVGYADKLVAEVNYPQTKDLWASWADSLSRIISPQALISAVPAVLFLQNANRLMLFAASKSL